MAKKPMEPKQESLIVVDEPSGALVVVETPEEKDLLQTYSALPELASLKKLINEGKAIRVNSELDVDQMAQAREYRLKLKSARCAVDNKRKELKREYLLKSRAIDGVANILEYVISPVEKHLEKQEKFIEYKREKELDALELDRKAKLGVYIKDVSFFNLREMSEEGFAQLLDGSKAAYEAQREAELVAAEERARKELEDKEEQERVLQENERLKKESEERDAAEKARRQEEEKKLASERAAREKAEAEARRIKEEADRKAKSETDEKERQEKARKAEEAKARKAPDKDKILKLADAVDALPIPEAKSEEAKRLLGYTKSRLLETTRILRKKVKEEF